MIPAATVVSTASPESPYARANSALAALGANGKKGFHMSPEQIDKAAKDFESMFVAQMLEGMFGESLGEEAFGGADSDEVYKSLMLQEYGKIIAASGGIGIASHVKNELLKQQEIGQ